MSHLVFNLQMLFIISFRHNWFAPNLETTHSEYLYDSMSFICHGQTHFISDEESDRRLEPFLEKSEKQNSCSWKQTLKFVTHSYSIYA